jgi:hypothetical protein
MAGSSCVYVCVTVCVCGVPVRARGWVAMQAAVELLEPMTEDAVDFVRQGALLALALVLIQHNEAMAPKARPRACIHAFFTATLTSLVGWVSR